MKGEEFLAVQASQRAERLPPSLQIMKLQKMEG
jgi:hypothetical protein